jgi:hypothetical protein
LKKIKNILNKEKNRRYDNIINKSLAAENFDVHWNMHDE